MTKTGKWDNKLLGILLGAVVTALMCVGAVAGCTQLVLTGKIGENSVEWCITVILTISAMIGCFTTSRLNSKQTQYTGVLTAALILAMMFISGLLIDGEFQKVLSRVGAVAAGYVASHVMCMKGKRKHGTRKNRIVNFNK